MKRPQSSSALRSSTRFAGCGPAGASFPGPVPASEFDNVFAALEGLGNTSRWAYSKLNEYAEKLSEPETKDLPLVRTAAELERLNREAVLTLLSLAFHDAEETSAGWMQALEGLEAEIADDLIDTVSVIKRRLRIFMAAQSEQGHDADPQAQDVEADPGDPDDTGPRDDHEDPASNLNHAARLREMADLLNNVADALAPPRLNSVQGLRWTTTFAVRAWRFTDRNLIDPQCGSFAGVASVCTDSVAPRQHSAGALG